MKHVIMMICTCLLLICSSALAKIPTENVYYSIENQGVNVEGVNGIGNYAYIKLENPLEAPELEKSLLSYVKDMEGRIYDVLNETKVQISQGKKSDVKKLMGHYESVLDVTRADNLVFSFEEQTIAWIDGFVPIVDVKYYNYATQTGEILNYNKVFKNKKAFSSLVAQIFAENNPEVKLPIATQEYFERRLIEEGYCFTGNGLRVVLGKDMGIPLFVEVPYMQLTEYVNNEYVPLQIMNNRRKQINNI